MKLWLDWAGDHWRDPRQVFAPGRLDTLTRRAFKALWFGVALFVLFAVAGPTNVASLQLWMVDDDLATATGWAFTLASALAFAIVRYAHEALPGWGLFGGRLKLPPLTVMLGGALVVGLLYVQLVSVWNYYLHDQLKTGGGAAVTLQTAGDSVADLEAALKDSRAREAAAIAAIDSNLARIGPDKTLTIRTLTAQRAAAVEAAAAERRDLRAQLDAARAANVATTQTVSDTRPVDGQLAAVFGLDRRLMASLNDLQRSGLVELLLILGAGLALTGATAPGRRQEDAPEEPAGETSDPREAEEPPKVVPISHGKRFLLPTATAADRAAAEEVA